MTGELSVHVGMPDLFRAVAGRPTSAGRILVVSSGVSGMAVACRRFARAANELGIDVDLVATRPAVVKRRPIRRRRAGVTLFEQVRHRRRWRRPRYDVETLAETLTGFSGLLVAGTGPAFPVLQASAASAVRTALLLDVTMERHAEQNDWQRNWLFRREVASERACFASADRLLCLSEWARESVVRDLALPEERTLIVPPVLARTEAPSVVARSGSLVRLASIGSPWIRKGTDRILDWLAQRPDAPVELHVFGDTLDGDEDRRVVQHGKVDNAELLHRHLPSMDLLVHPTRRDQSATVVVEAAWAGVASLATAVGGIPELIDDGVTGWLLRDQSPGTLSTALDDLVGDPSRVRTAGIAARRKAEAEFDADAILGPIAQWLAGDGPAPAGRQ